MDEKLSAPGDPVGSAPQVHRVQWFRPDRPVDGTLYRRHPDEVRSSAENGDDVSAADRPAEPRARDRG